VFVEPADVVAYQLDRLDDLAPFREDFYLIPGQIYLDGNSLGLASKPAEQALGRVLQAWKTLGIAGWTDAAPPWFTLAQELARRTAPLIGAAGDEVLVANSTTVNLHQLLATLYQPAGHRVKILADELAFPSDLYALHSHLRLRGRDPERDLILARSRDGLTLDENDIATAMTPEVQLAVLPAVLYRSGQLLDMAPLTREAHERGIVIGFDCCHSIGAVPHQLDDWDIDFAFWCSYKYLNGGPGAPGGLYLNRRYFGRAPGLAGWFSSRPERQFDMAPTLDPAPDAGALHIGTPNVLSLAPLLGALDTIALAGIERIRAKSLRLTAFLMELVETELAAFGFGFGNPREDHRRGGHVALIHPEAVRLCKALRQANVIPDYRPPNIVRLAPVALYTSFGDCLEAVGRLKVILQERLYEQFPSQRDLVP
jgi:kynureninase